MQQVVNSKYKIMSALEVNNQHENINQLYEYFYEKAEKFGNNKKLINKFAIKWMTKYIEYTYEERHKFIVLLDESGSCSTAFKMMDMK